MAYEVHGAGDPVVVFAPASGERHRWPATQGLDGFQALRLQVQLYGMLLLELA